MTDIPIPQGSQIQNGYIQDINNMTMVTAYLLGWRWHRTGAEPDGSAYGTNYIDKEGAILVWLWIVPGRHSSFARHILVHVLDDNPDALMVPQMLTDHVIAAYDVVREYGENPERTPKA
jgi:hypothetical protein